MISLYKEVQFVVLSERHETSSEETRVVERCGILAAKKLKIL